MKRPPSLETRKLQVENWNLKNKVGCAVTVQMDGGGTRQTVTRSEAQLLSGHTPVVWLEGISGCYTLEKITAVTHS